MNVLGRTVQFYMKTDLLYAHDFRKIVIFMLQGSMQLFFICSIFDFLVYVQILNADGLLLCKPFTANLKYLCKQPFLNM